MSEARPTNPPQNQVIDELVPASIEVEAQPQEIIVVAVVPVVSLPLMSKAHHDTETIIDEDAPVQKTVKVHIDTSMIEDTLNNSEILTIFNGVPQFSSVLHLAIHDEYPNADPEYISSSRHRST